MIKDWIFFNNFSLSILLNPTFDARTFPFVVSANVGGPHPFLFSPAECNLYWPCCMPSHCRWIWCYSHHNLCCFAGCPAWIWWPILQHYHTSPRTVGLRQYHDVCSINIDKKVRSISWSSSFLLPRTYMILSCILGRWLSSCPPHYNLGWQEYNI